MAYNILSSGNQKKRQAIDTFGGLARQEQNRNMVNDRLDAQSDAQRNDAIGQVAGMAGQYAIKDYLKRPSEAVEITERGATTAEIDAGTAVAEGATGGEAALVNGGAPIVEQGATTAAIDAGGAVSAAESGAAVATEAAALAETAALAEGATAATTAATAATGGTAATATGGALASSGGAMAAAGPAGWALGVGLLAYQLFG